MSRERFFLDTAYALALLNRRDQYHDAARQLFPRVRQAEEVWTTHAVLFEIANALSRLNRTGVVRFIRECFRAPNVRVEAIDAALFLDGLGLYEQRSDKEWGLTDCLSFVVMQKRELRDALTADAHFEQAGFRALLGDPSARAK